MKLGYRLYIYVLAIIFNFYRPTHVSLMQKKSYQQKVVKLSSSEKTKNNDEQENSNNTKA